ncbi:MAG: hypothetical protein H6712_09005 [Myxococcales bacterium]|nr:hypothetical protein [Myxococcales bacterium]
MTSGSVVRHHLRSWLGQPRLRRRWLTGLVVGGLSFVPLAGTLGYESSFLLSPLAALLGLAVGVDGVRALRSTDAAPKAPLREVARRGAIELAILAAIALGLLVVSQLWQRNCDPWGGLGFFVMGPGLSVVMGWVAGLWGGALRERRWAQLLVASAIPATSTAIGLWRLWGDPVVFAYDPFWGYFSGAIYDEAVSIGSTYLSFRAYNLLAAAAGLGLWRLLVSPPGLRLRRPPSWGRALLAGTPSLIAASLAAWIGLRGAAMGFTADIESITEVLSATRETEHFIIHYEPRSATAREIDAVATEHELAWHLLREEMGRAPEGRVRSFVFGNPGQKRALMGAGTVQVAAPWRQQIYLDYRPFPHPVITHELAHVFGKTVGDGLFGVSVDGIIPNIALIEGFATALGPRPADRLDLHDQATVLERLGKRPPLSAIMGPAFFTRSSRVAYTTAGSFCRWLIDTRGFEGMARLYHSGGDFAESYGEPLDELERQWLAFLESRSGVTDDDVQAMAQRYERGSVFQRPCAHRAADLMQEAARARAQGRVDEVVDRYRTLCTIEPEQPEHVLGLAQALAEAERFEDALAAIDDVLQVEDLTMTIRAAMLEKRADVALAAGELPVAAEALDEALALPVTETQHRGLLLKREAARDADLAALVGAYYLLFEVDEDPISGAVARLWYAQRIRELPGYHALGTYLVARQLINVQRPAAARSLLEDALAEAESEEGRGLPGPEFVREARQQLVAACVQTGRFDEADALLDQLEAEPGIGNGHRMEYAQWRRRVAYFREYQAR